MSGIEEAISPTGVAAHLREPLAVNDIPQLKHQLAQCEAFSEEVSRNYRQAQQLLTQQRRQYLLPMDRKLHSDLDRTVGLEAATRDTQVMVDVLGDQLDIIRNRIRLGIAILGDNHVEE